MVRDHVSLRWASVCLVWALWAVVAAVELGAQEIGPAADEHLVDPRIVERAGERVLEVRTVGDPDEIGSAAFGLLFQLYFSSEAETGFAPPVARARWQEGLEEYIVGPTMAGPGNPEEYHTILRYRVRRSDALGSPFSRVHTPNSRRSAITNAEGPSG